MRRRIKLLTLLSNMAVLSVVVGCGKIGSDPKDVLSKYLDASLHRRHEEAYKYISSKDRAIKSQEEYLSENSKVDSPFIQVLTNKISYKIKDVIVTGNKAKASVDITGPDFTVIVKDILGMAFISAFGPKKDEKEMEKMIAEKYQGKDIPIATNTQSFDMVKESDGWKVFFDWETQKTAEETKKKVDEVMKEAQQLENEKKLYAAKEKYRQVLELDSKAVEASAKIKDLDKKIEGFREKQVYIDKIEIRNLNVAETVLGGFGVFGEVKNLGQRTLTKVEITIYFLDSNDNPIFEDTYHPVWVSEFSFGDENQPLKPGYSRKFGMRADNAPSDWAKKVRVKVTDIEFEER